MTMKKTKDKTVEDVILGLECCGSGKDRMFLCLNCPYSEDRECPAALKRDAARLLRAAYLQGGESDEQG